MALWAEFLIHLFLVFPSVATRTRTRGIHQIIIIPFRFLLFIKLRRKLLRLQSNHLFHWNSKMKWNTSCVMAIKYLDIDGIEFYWNSQSISGQSRIDPIFCIPSLLLWWIQGTPAVVCVDWGTHRILCHSIESVPTLSPFILSTAPSSIPVS